MPDIGVPELLIIMVIAILVFGVGRLPEIGGAIGRSLREFREATREGARGADEAQEELVDTQAAVNVEK